MSAAVGAFLVGIALSGPVAHHASQLLAPLRDLFATVFFVFFGLTTDPTEIPPVLLPAFALAVVTMATKVVTGYVAAGRAGIAVRGRWRAGFALTPRGEFSIVIAGLAVAIVGCRAAPAAARRHLRVDHRRHRSDHRPPAGSELVQGAGQPSATGGTGRPAGRGLNDTPPGFRKCHAAR